MTTDGWLPDLRHAGVKFQAIAASIIRAIENGDLRPGARLPPQRSLAQKLGVDLSTITKAYDSLRYAGLIDGRGRAGSFVRKSEAVSPHELAKLETGMNMPPELPGGMLGRALAEATTHLLANGSTTRLQYEPAGGTARDRRIASDFLTSGGLATDEERVVITAGGQNALSSILAISLKEGDAVLCGEHAYPGFKAALVRVGARAVATRSFDIEHLREVCSTQHIRAIYIVPTNDNPTTRTFSKGEREAIAAVAQEFGIMIIEDDAYGRLSPAPCAAIASHAPDNSWYIASTSKIVSPALRVAYVRAPSISGALKLRSEIHATAVMAPPLNVAIASYWLANGTFERLVDAMRAEAGARQAIAQTRLGGHRFSIATGGYHLWLKISPSDSASQIAEVMRSHGLATHSSAQFAISNSSESALRVSLGGLISHEHLARCLEILSGYLTDANRMAGGLI